MVEEDSEVFIQSAVWVVPRFQVGIVGNQEFHLIFWNLFVPSYKAKIEHLNIFLHKGRYFGLMTHSPRDTFSSLYYLVSHTAGDNCLPFFFFSCNDFKRSLGSLYLSKSKQYSRFLLATITNPGPDPVLGLHYLKRTFHQGQQLPEILVAIC